MSAGPTPVVDHYTVGNLADRILAAFTVAGVDLDALTVDDLAAVDAFHIRGRAATEELAVWAEVATNHLVLDVGSGIGGTARYLATVAGCRVTGIDLTPEYCEVARIVSKRLGLDSRMEFRTASALDLPFEDATFDIVWTEHVQMNIPDKHGFYGELVRVLRPGGRLAFHDVFAGPEGPPLRFPVPWAGEASISHLAAVETVAELLRGAGLRVLRWEDKTAASVEFFRSAFSRFRNAGQSPVGLHLLMRKETSVKFENLLHNLEQDSIRVVQAVLERPS